MSNLTYLSTKLTTLPTDQIFQINGEYKADNHPNKMNLSIGAYTDDNGDVYVLETVKKAKKLIQQDSKDSHQYLPITGYPDLKNVVAELIFGEDADSYSTKLAAYQSLGGTGGFFLGASFLKQFCDKSRVVIPSKTWTSHRPIFAKLGFDVMEYRIETDDSGSLAIGPILEDLEKFPEMSVVVMQACCHNPCGLDPDREGWRQIANLIKRRNLIPFLDLAYMGFGSENMADDAWPLRLFADMEMDFLVSVSFSKNFGLYGERIGCLVVFTQNPECQKAISSNVGSIIRVTNSNPPSFGAKIILKIFADSQLYAEWQEELRTMMIRVLRMREKLHEELANLGIEWPQILKARGFFFESPLRGEQVERLKTEWKVYIVPNGRVNMAGLLENRVGYFAKAIKAVLG